MMWIKEVEVAKSVDVLMTSQSVEGHVFPDFEMLDAKIASCSKIRQISQRKTDRSYTDLFNVSLKGDDIQDFDTRWDQALLSASKVPKENVMESLCKIRIRESVRLQTLAMYDQEIDRDRTMASYQRLKTMVRRQINQMISTRNIRARNERIETGV